MFILFYILKFIFSDHVSNIVLIQNTKLHPYTQRISEGETLRLKCKLVSGSSVHYTLVYVKELKGKILNKKMGTLTETEDFNEEFTNPGIYTIRLYSVGRKYNMVNINITTDKNHNENKLNDKLSANFNKMFDKCEASYWLAINTFASKDNLMKMLKKWIWRSSFLIILCPFYLLIAYAKNYYLESFFKVKKETI